MPGRNCGVCALKECVPVLWYICAFFAPQHESLDVINTTENKLNISYWFAGNLLFTLVHRLRFEWDGQVDRARLEAVQWAHIPGITCGAMFLSICSLPEV